MSPRHLRQQQLQKLGYSVAIEAGAGINAKFQDSDYQAANVTVIDSTKDLYRMADIILKVRASEQDELSLLKPEQVLICASTGTKSDLLQTLADKKVDALAMESIPRISRSQKMDALSSMANIAGYLFIIEAGTFRPLFTDKSLPLARYLGSWVLIIGAGVAGLPAIGTAKSIRYRA